MKGIYTGHGLHVTLSDEYEPMTADQRIELLGGFNNIKLENN